MLLVTSFALAGTVAVEGNSTAGPSNSIPFGGPSSTCLVSAGYQGFVYQNIPAFDLAVGDTIAFDLGAVNDVDIEVDIDLAAAVSNGSTEQDATGFVSVVTAGTPASPRGNAVAGDFELAFTAEAPFSFAGGGLIIRFQATGSYAADTNCTQVLMSATSSDTSGYFVGRFYSDTSGTYPWTGSDSSYVGEVRFTYSDGTPWYADADGDGYGDATDSVISVAQPTGYVADATDCDDLDFEVYPDAPESCNLTDDDCDGTVDEDDAVDALTWYADADGDTYGDPASFTLACTVPSGFVEDDTDCDDTDATAYPGATEVCDGADDDCDGDVDEDEAVDAAEWTEDQDGDGYGAVGGATTFACAEPEGYSATDDDCDDARAATWPGADEACNGWDDDCDGDVDEPSSVDALLWYADTDGDTYGDPLASTPACAQPAGYVADATDCDDTHATSFPGATELCNGLDDDCDDRLDEDDAADAPTWYADADADGHGDEAVHRTACTQPDGYELGAGDCDDRDATVNPDAEETWYDGVDQDCDGNDDDQDDDGVPVDDDCDDTDDARSPDLDEVWYDGVDADCAGDSDYDQDGDGQDSASYGGPDCDDADATVYDGAVDDPYDGRITDCSNASEFDADADGHLAQDYGGDDCDDANGDIHPGADDVAGNGLDEDCDGSDAAAADTGAVDVAPGACGCGAESGAAASLAGLGALAVIARRRRG